MGCCSLGAVAEACACEIRNKPRYSGIEDQLNEARDQVGPEAVLAAVRARDAQLLQGMRPVPDRIPPIEHPVFAVPLGFGVVLTPALLAGKSTVKELRECCGRDAGNGTRKDAPRAIGFRKEPPQEGQVTGGTSIGDGQTPQDPSPSPAVGFWFAREKQLADPKRTQP